MINIRYINNAGGGFNGRIQVAEGTTVMDLFRSKMGGEDPRRFNIRVNAGTPTEGQILRENDTVSIVPGKYDGGATMARTLRDLANAIEQNPTFADDLTTLVELGNVLSDGNDEDIAADLGAVTKLIHAVRAGGPPSPAAVQAAQGCCGARSAPPDPASIGAVSVSEGGNGFARSEQLRGTETILRFFERMKGANQESRFFIRVNGKTVDPNTYLRPGDAVLIRPLHMGNPDLG